MKPEVQEKLVAVNHLFYQTLAAPFSATRARVQPGVLRILDSLPVSARLLDLGCGNGNLARELHRRGHQGAYVGLDYSKALIEANRRYTGDLEDLEATFLEADLTAPDWDLQLPEVSFDAILAFAVLHHLPGTDLRRTILQKVHALLISEGHFYLSNWQFLKSPRWQGRIQPWERVGLSADDVGPDDYLLDWRHGGYGLRYVHHFSQEELVRLASETGFQVVDTYQSDGAGGKLGLYQVWKKGQEREGRR